MNVTWNKTSFNSVGNQPYDLLLSNYPLPHPPASISCVPLTGPQDAKATDLPPISCRNPEYPWQPVSNPREKEAE